MLGLTRSASHNIARDVLRRHGHDRSCHENTDCELAKLHGDDRYLFAKATANETKQSG